MMEGFLIFIEGTHPILGKDSPVRLLAGQSLIIEKIHDYCVQFENGDDDWEGCHGNVLCSVQKYALEAKIVRVVPSGLTKKER